MSRRRHGEAQMIGPLKQLEAGRKAEDVAREVGLSKHKIYAWKAKYGGMDVSHAEEAKQLRDENTRLRKLVLRPGLSSSGAGCSPAGTGRLVTRGFINSFPASGRASRVPTIASRQRTARLLGFGRPLELPLLR